MTAKALNDKMDESEILEIKNDPFSRLTANVDEASAEESEEILAGIEGLSDGDLAIASAEHLTV